MSLRIPGIPKSQEGVNVRKKFGAIGLSIVVGFGGLLGLLVTISEPVQAQTWTALIVEEDRVVRGHTSIAMDSGGVPHIVHNELGPNNLRYVTKSGISWSSEVVDTSLVGNYHYRYTSIALDNNEYPHISYYWDAMDDLKYARWDGNAWNVEFLDTTGDVGGFSSLALDGSGYPHIAYYDETNDDLKYMRWDGAAWNMEVVDSVSSVGAYSSLELDASGFPHISYYNATSGDLMYAKWNGGSWVTEAVDSSGNVGKWTSLALDASDYPHISYYDVDNGDLRYARWTGSDWDIQAISSVFDVGQYTSIDVDGSGNAHVCYFDVSNGDLVYVHIAGMSRDIYAVDTPGVVGKWASLDLDGAGHPHISYYDETKKDIKYATTAPLPPTAPQNFQGTPSDGQVTLSWTQPVSDGGFAVTNYRVYHSTVPGSEALLVKLGVEFSYVHSGLTNGQLQYYFVTAINSIGEGLPSVRIAVAPATTPLAPQNLAEKPGDGFVNLSWDAPSYDGNSTITNYTVYRGPFSGGEGFLVELGVEYYYNDTSVTNGATYFYKVTAKNSLGEGEPSAISATPGLLPSEPLNLASEASDSLVDLTWDPPQSDGGSAITDYRVYRGLTSGGETFLVEVGLSFSYADSNVTNGQTYYYVVRAKNPIGEGPPSWEVSATPLGLPSEPQDVAAYSGLSFVNLSWSEPASDGGSPITNYIIYRGATEDGVSLLTEIGAALSYNDTEVTNGVTYFYKMSARTAVGEGPQSNAVNSTPINIAPVCTVISPLIGATVSGLVAVSGSASDTESEVQRVEIRIDNSSWEIVTGTKSWAHIWDSATVSNGLHVIVVRSFDGENYSQETTVQVMVDNQETEKPFFEEMWFLILIVLIIVVIALVVVFAMLRRRGKGPASEKLESEASKTGEEAE